MPPPPPPPPSYGGPPAPPPGFQPYPMSGPSAANYAGFGARLGGYLLDSLLYGLLAAVFWLPSIFFFREAYDDCVTFNDEILCPDGSPKPGMMAAAIGLIAIGVVLVAIIYLRALGRTGQTWGRKIVGVKVIGKDTGQPIGAGKAFLRLLVAGVASSSICYLGYLWMLWDKDKQTWHDKVINTVVVRT